MDYIVRPYRYELIDECFIGTLPQAPLFLDGQQTEIAMAINARFVLALEKDSACIPMIN